MKIGKLVFKFWKNDEKIFYRKTDNSCAGNNYSVHNFLQIFLLTFVKTRGKLGDTMSKKVAKKVGGKVYRNPNQSRPDAVFESDKKISTEVAANSEKPVGSHTPSQFSIPTPTHWILERAGIDFITYNGTEYETHIDGWRVCFSIPNERWVASNGCFVYGPFDNLELAVQFVVDRIYHPVAKGG